MKLNHICALLKLNNTIQQSWLGLGFGLFCLCNCTLRLSYCLLSMTYLSLASVLCYIYCGGSRILNFLLTITVSPVSIHDESREACTSVVSEGVRAFVLATVLTSRTFINICNTASTGASPRGVGKNTIFNITHRIQI
jgi:hypothetical protein